MINQCFNVIIEKDEDGFLVASVPSLKGCHTQAKSYDQLMERIQEAIELCLEKDSFPKDHLASGRQDAAIDFSNDDEILAFL
jgi:predicted RNase H-like HicB family nuclease